MDDDWDLHAVVRGCAAANLPSYDDHNSFASSGSLVDDTNDSFQSLQEIYQNFCADEPPETSHQDIMITQMKPPLRLNMQIQENLQFNITTESDPPQAYFPAAAIPQAVGPRRRKNQQMKMIREMTQEELSADSWAWRKYGQKPIKGSPYPRNYYRCSTSKGCAARKQVERSPNNPDIFIVSYSGDHAHPRPTHRSSLAGSTRAKLASQKCSTAASSSSPAAASSFSQATPSMEGEAPPLKEDDVQIAEEDEGASDEDDDTAVMIPGDLMNDDNYDMFRGFRDTDDNSSGGVGDFNSSGLRSYPPWIPTSSAATFNGVGD